MFDFQPEMPYVISMNKEIIQMKINDLAREKRFATCERIEQINRFDKSLAMGSSRTSTEQKIEDGALERESSKSLVANRLGAPARASR